MSMKLLWAVILLVPLILITLRFLNIEMILLGILLFINIVSFIIVANDKRQSMRGGNPDRTPEGFIFFLAAAGGSGGVYLAMQLFRHKTRKWYFQLGIPLLILQNFATVYAIKTFMSSM